ncbi:MAG TPA: MoaD/ThiS family protein [Gaiellaceae bacterium]|nr:MoaD/ThiS family protein [Gaiellaceae bacterium]
MVVVVLPSLLAAQAGGKGRFEVDGATVEHALRQLPVADLLIDEAGELRRLVNVYVDGTDARELGGLHADLEGAHELRVIAAVAGGTNRRGTGSARSAEGDS